MSALVLLSIEKIINKVFKYKSQLEGFYSLLATKKEEVGAIGKFLFGYLIDEKFEG